MTCAIFEPYGRLKNKHFHERNAAISKAFGFLKEHIGIAQVCCEALDYSWSLVILNH